MNSINKNRFKRILLLAAALAGAGGLFLAYRLSVAPREGGLALVDKARAAEEQTYYTCPMHPQVVSDKPGTCPICGMNLVKKKGPVPGGDMQVRGGEIEGEAGKDGQGRRIKYWVAPMDPTYISEKPGKSPMGMDLVPVYEDDGAAGGGASEEGGKKTSDEIRIDPVVVQDMGVRVAKVKRGTVVRRVRTIGEVEVAEDRISVVNLRFSGWIEKIWIDETGQKVEKGDPLFRIYSPEVVTAQEEYLMAVNTSGKESKLARAARRRLELWEIPEAHIRELLKTGNGQLTLTLNAPQSGYVLKKNVVLGARVNAGTDLYRIGDLRKIWVNAEVYEFDAPWIELGQRATMELSFEAGREYEGRVSYIYPTLDEKTRTLLVRLEFENPGIRLKPGMFATVRIAAQKKTGVLVIPSEAILRTGERQLVFITPRLGHYEPRQIVTGLVGDGGVTEVLSGLKAGETVVTSGQFLLDSESQLREAVQKFLEARLQSKEAKSGEAESGADAGRGKPAEGQTDEAQYYYTCSMHPQVVREKPGVCPICGMDLVKKRKK